MIALGSALVERGHTVALDTWQKWREPVEAAGMTFTQAPEYQVFPTREKPLKPYAAAVRAAQEIRPFVRDFAPDVAVADILTPGTRARRRARGRAAGDARAARLSVRAGRASDLLDRGAPPAHGAGRGAVDAGEPALRGAVARGGARAVQRDPPPARARAAAVGPHRALARADHRRDAAAARVPAALGALGAGGGAAAVGAARRAGRAAAGPRPGRADRPLDLAGPASTRSCARRSRASPTPRCA